MSEPADGARSLERAERAFERGDYLAVRRLLHPLRGADGEIGSRAREALRGVEPERHVLWVSILCALGLAVLFGYYVIGR